ncbi:MAG: mechanosensitive ion channel family protein [Thiolinea sp.]
MDRLNNILGTGYFETNVLMTVGKVLLLIAVYLLLKNISKFLYDKISRKPAIQNHQDKTHAFAKMLKRTLFTVFAGTILLIITYNAYQTIQGINLQQHTLDHLAKIPQDFWTGLLLGFFQIFILIALTYYLSRLIEQLLGQLEQKSIAYKQLERNNASVATFFNRLNQIQKAGLWLTVIYLAMSIIPLPEDFADTVLLVLRVYLIISIALLIVNSVAILVDSLDELSQKYAKRNNLLVFYEELHRLIPVLRRTLEYIVYATAATLVLHQIDFVASLAEYGPGIIQGIGFVFIGRVIVEVINLLIDKTFLHDKLSSEERQKNLTIFPIIKSVLAALVYFAVLILILRGIGFDPLPLLAGAGIASMVFGLGAQSLINDILTGFFIIFEGQFKVGDFIEIDDARGNVEKLSLRTTSIRSPDGQLHTLRNGKIDKIINFSKRYVNTMIDVGVDPDSNLQHITDVVAQLGREMQTSDDTILEPTEVLGIEDISGPEIIVRTMTRLAPGKQLVTSRKIRHQIIQRFKQENIRIPFEQRWAYFHREQGA